MIYLDVVGRCGNQMFQYAFARKLSIVNNDEEICIDFFHVYAEGERRKDPSFKNELKNFKASEQFETLCDGRNKIFQHGSKEQIIVFKIYTKIKRFLQKFSSDKRIAEKIMYKILNYYGIYWYFSSSKINSCRQKNKFVWGYFENPEYFNDIQEELCNDFEPLNEKKIENLELYETIQDTNSVCVSFRKWGEEEPVNEDWFVCDEKYYKEAIERIIQIVPEARLVVFSNDIDWVKHKFELPENCLWETGSDDIYEKMRLMYSCKHFILSNSTFAWWAQFLGQDKKKIVIAPYCWHKNEKNPLIQAEFLKVGKE